MAITWQRVFLGAVNNSDTVLYTVPAGKKLIVRQTNYVDTNANSTGLTLAIGTTATLTNIYDKMPVTTGVTTTRTDQRVVVAAGEVIHGLAGAHACVVALFGWLVDI